MPPHKNIYLKTMIPPPKKNRPQDHLGGPTVLFSYSFYSPVTSPCELGILLYFFSDYSYFLGSIFICHTRVVSSYLGPWGPLQD